MIQNYLIFSSQRLRSNQSPLVMTYIQAKSLCLVLLSLELNKFLCHLCMYIIPSIGHVLRHVGWLEFSILVFESFSESYFQLHFNLLCFILFQEGISILMGLSYNGKDKNGNILWDGVSNVKLYQQETCSTFREAIEAFNYNTNKWMFR